MERPSAPEVFGKYELLDRIAIGGMAEVFRARLRGDGGFEKHLVIKRILPHLSQDADFVVMLIDEARIAVSLNHPNIVQIYDLGKLEGTYYIAMELIEGGDLKVVLQRGKRLPIPHALYITIEVLKGLEYAHQKMGGSKENPVPLNIIHRDISPPNILLSYEGEVKLVDFGIAKASVRLMETSAGILKGKFEYMSPEQASGLVLDHRSDLFSTAILLYEMLTGRSPFDGTSDLMVLQNVRMSRAIPPSQLNPDIPPKLEQIILKGLAREKDDRYQRAADMRNDLMAFAYASGFVSNPSRLAAYMRTLFPNEVRAGQVAVLDAKSGADARIPLQSSGATPGLPREPIPAPRRTAAGPGEDEEVPTIALQLPSPVGPRNSARQSQRIDAFAANGPPEQSGRLSDFAPLERMVPVQPHSQGPAAAPSASSVVSFFGPGQAAAPVASKGTAPPVNAASTGASPAPSKPPSRQTFQAPDDDGPTAIHASPEEEAANAAGGNPPIPAARAAFPAPPASPAPAFQAPPGRMAGGARNPGAAAPSASSAQAGGIAAPGPAAQGPSIAAPSPGPTAQNKVPSPSPVPSASPSAQAPLAPPANPRVSAPIASSAFPRPAPTPPGPPLAQTPLHLPAVAAVPALPRGEEDLELDSINEVMEQTGSIPLSGATLSSYVSSPPLPAGRGPGAVTIGPRADAAASDGPSPEQPRADKAWLESLRPERATQNPAPTRAANDWPPYGSEAERPDALGTVMPPPATYDPFATRPAFDVPPTGVMALPGSQSAGGMYPNAGRQTGFENAPPFRPEATPTRLGEPIPLASPTESLEEARRRRTLARLTGFFAGLIPGLLMAAWFSMKDKEDGRPAIPSPVLTIHADPGIEVLLDNSPAGNTFPLKIPLSPDQDYRVQLVKPGAAQVEKTLKLGMGTMAEWFVIDMNDATSTPAPGAVQPDPASRSSAP